MPRGLIVGDIDILRLRKPKPRSSASSGILHHLGVLGIGVACRLVGNEKPEHVEEDDVEERACLLHVLLARAFTTLVWIEDVHVREGVVPGNRSPCGRGEL